MRTILSVTALLTGLAAFAQEPDDRPAEPTREEAPDVTAPDVPDADVEAVVPPPSDDVAEPGDVPPLAGPALAALAEAGRAKSATCAACHGADGNSFNPEWPSLAGQHARYIFRQLKAYQSGARQHVLMTPQAQGLSTQDMRELAAFFASRTAQLRTADPALVRLGETIYRGGNPESGVSACIACHGPTGSGNAAAAYARVRGQHALYLANTLRAYADGERRSDPNQIMRNIASLLEDDEIEAVASYMQGLRTD